MDDRRPNVYEMKVLTFLAQCGGQGGFTSGGISRGAGIGSTRSMMSVNRCMVIVPMVDMGWLAPLDDAKPVIFCITAAGRAALSGAETEAKP